QHTGFFAGRKRGLLRPAAMSFAAGARKFATTTVSFRTEPAMHSGASTLSRGIASGAREMSADEMTRAATRMAGGLAGLGVSAGDCVAILMRNDFPFLIASYGAIALGAFAVPINWHLKPDEVAYVLADSGAKVLVAHADLLRATRDSIPPGLPVLVVETP